MIAIIDYNAGNTRSVLNACKRLNAEVEITSEKDLIKQADRVIFPGVGEASSAMQFLRQSGLDSLIKLLNQPVLGICLGLQLMCEHSEENNTGGLGIFDVSVRRFSDDVIVPHMGWNSVQKNTDSPILNEVNLEDFYFVHSYYAEMSKYTLASCNYGVDFSAVMQKDNFYAAQFHPEKSSKSGQKLIKNFLEL